MPSYTNSFYISIDTQSIRLDAHFRKGNFRKKSSHWVLPIFFQDDCTILMWKLNVSTFTGHTMYRPHRKGINIATKDRCCNFKTVAASHWNKKSWNIYDLWSNVNMYWFVTTLQGIANIMIFLSSTWIYLKALMIVNNVLGLFWNN
jgi:hypothetical protein